MILDQFFVVLHNFNCLVGQVTGFMANPVIGDNGSIIGVDILSVGSGYQPNENVYAQIVDAVVVVEVLLSHHS